MIRASTATGPGTSPPVAPATTADPMDLPLDVSSMAREVLVLSLDMLSSRHAELPARLRAETAEVPDGPDVPEAPTVPEAPVRSVQLVRPRPHEVPRQPRIPQDRRAG